MFDCFVDDDNNPGFLNSMISRRNTNEHIKNVESFDLTSENWFIFEVICIVFFFFF